MAVERRRQADREIRLEGAGLLLASLVLLAGLIGAFQAGRWFEGRSSGNSFAASPFDGRPSGDGAGFQPHGDVIQEPVDLESETDVFDRADPSTAEPQREATTRDDRGRSRSRDSGRTTERAEEVTPAQDGRYWVQVFAGRDEDGAAQVVDRLRSSGFPVKLFRDREGRGTLYKVRVGGYDERGAARDAAGRLQSAGFSGAWVTEDDSSS